MDPSQMEEYRKQAEMNQAAQHMDLNSFYDSLSKEQASTLQKLMYDCASHEGLALNVAGTLEGMLRYKYNTCACGLPVGHEYEMPTEEVSAAEQTSAAFAVRGVEPVDAEPDEVEQFVADLENMPEGSEERNMAEDLKTFQEQCRLYNVAPWPEGYKRSEDDLRVYCLGCNKPYVSLLDRSLREPGPNGCTGCQELSRIGAIYPKPEEQE